MRICDIKDVDGLKRELINCQNKLQRTRSYQIIKIENLVNKITVLKHIIKREERLGNK
jgi:hypothetical protein